ncbi:hypothetical protein ACHHYP_09878 [Achlya hypogyna]|uniref:Mini-chromosome maintenance complex-binding protein n=1 Tax=Achlya hypogyna TaxID=1202772 RepID=A0A1V9ZJ56_ACHHY|nr:hypothetical protein ACHHYP_09878 [Achlya hypogyna]
MAVLLNRSRLDVGAVAHGSRVRFVGLVRDVGQPQLFVQADDSYVETTPHRVEALPAQTAWAKEHDHVAPPELAPAARKAKRRLEDESSAETEDADAILPPPAPATRIVEAAKVTAPPLAPRVFEVIVRAYGGEQWKVNHVYEFIGDLDLTPQATSDDMDIEWQDADTAVVKEKAQVLEFIPTLHAKEFHELPFGHEVGYSSELPTTWAMAQWEQRMGTPVGVDAVRAALLEFLTATVTHGDALAAEYLLLVLLSRVYNRSDVSMPFGHLSLNLIWPDMTDENFATIERALHLVVPTCLSVNLSLAGLHDALYFPQKDYDIEYLHSGLLQLPDGSMLLVNEANMTTGQLDDKATHNIAALMTLVEHQALPYDFRFYKKEFNQDTKVLCVSKTKSMLPTTLFVPLRPTQAQETSWTEAWLECFRIYLAAYRHAVADLGEAGASLAEQWYVAKRKEDATVGADDLHRLVRVARLHAVSVGHETVSEADWNHVVAMQEQVKARMSS